MKIVLVCPSNLLYMPYVENYIEILDNNKIKYDLITWNRFNLENEEGKYQYTDNKYGHQRNIYDYYKYKKFVVSILKKNQYKQIIVFGIQLSFILRKLLLNKYENNYIIDIRDRNKLINFFDISRVIESSNFTVLSSKGYKEWLPNSEKYIINHNTRLKKEASLDLISEPLKKNKKIVISYIGAIRDYNVNLELIKSLRNSKKIQLDFHGEGPINQLLLDYIEANKINNVEISGRYERKYENNLYEKSDMINVLRYNEGINNATALPNRLYNAVIKGKPLVALPGTYLSEVIEAYSLGLVLDSQKDIEQQIMDYVNNFDRTIYDENRRRFIESVIFENKEFENFLSNLK